jgi:hypothetical protein
MIPLIAASQAVRMSSRKAKIEKTAVSSNAQITKFFKPFSIDKPAEKGDAFGLSLPEDLNIAPDASEEFNAPRSSRSASTPRPFRRSEALEEPALSHRRVQASPARMRPTTTSRNTPPITPPVTLHLEQPPHAAAEAHEAKRTSMPPQPAPITPQQQPRPHKHGQHKASTSKISVSTVSQEVQKQILLEKAAKLGIPLVESEQQTPPCSKPRAPRTAQRTSASPRRRNSLPCVSAFQLEQLEQLVAGPSEAAMVDSNGKDQMTRHPQAAATSMHSNAGPISSICSKDSGIAAGGGLESLLQVKESLRSNGSVLKEPLQLSTSPSTGSLKPSYPTKSSRFDLQWTLFEGRWVRK